MTASRKRGREGARTNNAMKKKDYYTPAENVPCHSVGRLGHYDECAPIE